MDALPTLLTAPELLQLVPFSVFLDVPFVTYGVILSRVLYDANVSGWVEGNQVNHEEVYSTMTVRSYTGGGSVEQGSVATSDSFSTMQNFQAACLCQV